MRHRVSTVLTTLEMPLWTSEETAPRELYPEPVAYTVLGPYVPYSQRVAARSMVPYARRVEHSARHGVRRAKGQILRWAHSKAREIGEFWVGAFQPIKEAF